MLIYHPALDPYHSAFRMLHLLGHAPTQPHDRRSLRILDFYAVFPQLISTIRLPMRHSKWRRRFADQENHYWFSGERSLVFARMEPLQETALNLLYAQGLVDPDRYDKGQVQLVLEQFRRINLSELKSLPHDVFEFLVTVLATFPFQGVGGLKDRTGLLESRYDAT